jgi:hypothetical protein
VNDDEFADAITGRDVRYIYTADIGILAMLIHTIAGSPRRQAYLNTFVLRASQLSLNLSTSLSLNLNLSTIGYVASSCRVPCGVLDLRLRNVPASTRLY